jgi:hypothetical protein
MTFTPDITRTRAAAARRKQTQRQRRQRELTATTVVGFNLGKARRALLAVGSLSREEALDDGNVRKAIGMLAEDLVANRLTGVTP